MIAAGLVAIASTVSAFEEQGHTMAAQLMTMYLNEGAKTYLTELIGEDWQRQVIALAPRVEQDVTRAKNRPYLPLQQTLFSIEDTEFEAAKHCPNNACSVGAVLESRQVLLESQYSNAKKRQALGFLMHYMVQLHSPINCGFERDMGGQKIYLKDSDLKPVNLAWIWNYDLYRKFEERWFTLAQRYYRDMEKIDLESWVETLSPQEWAFESHLIARETVYGLAVEGRYSAKLVREGQKVIETQLQKAAYRTAMLLNEMWG
ncbi:MAG: hypothetical protein ACI9DO_000199 [Reinekea sp.]